MSRLMMVANGKVTMHIQCKKILTKLREMHSKCSNKYISQPQRAANAMPNKQWVGVNKICHLVGWLTTSELQRYQK